MRFTLSQATSSSLPHRRVVCDRRTADPRLRRHGTTSLFAALDVKTGTGIGQPHRRRPVCRVRKFLDRVDAQRAPDVDVHLIMDNYDTHTTPRIQACSPNGRGSTFTARPTLCLVAHSLSSAGSLAHNNPAPTTQRLSKRPSTRRDADSGVASTHDHAEGKPFVWTKTCRRDPG